jgi:hypothetical protein
LRVYSSACSAVVSNVHDAEVLLVEPAEVNGSKVHGPEAFAHLYKSGIHLTPGPAGDEIQAAF